VSSKSSSPGNPASCNAAWEQTAADIFSDEDYQLYLEKIFSKKEGGKNIQLVIIKANEKNK